MATTVAITLSIFAVPAALAVVPTISVTLVIPPALSTYIVRIVRIRGRGAAGLPGSCSVMMRASGHDRADGLKRVMFIQ